MIWVKGAEEHSNRSQNQGYAIFLQIIEPL
jgi:hypothetical protein